jgi:AmmeMemoRadiSam system protein A
MKENSTTPHDSSGSAGGLSVEDKDMLLRIARLALHDYFTVGKLPQYSADSTRLLEPRAAFVTLWRRDSGELRGCRGECQAQRPLIQSVAQMAVAAAVDDSRFESVTIEEVPDLLIEINALTPLTPIKPEEVIVGRHGLMVVQGYMMGLLLPEVPVRQGWDRTGFLRGVCRKAGLPADAWRAEGTQLFGFEAEVWSEKE